MHFFFGFAHQYFVIFFLQKVAIQFFFIHYRFTEQRGIAENLRVHVVMFTTKEIE